MHCQSCGGTKKLYAVSAKCSDMCSIQHIGGRDHDGYVPEWLGGYGKGVNAAGDYVDITICRHCGTVQGEWPHYNKDENQFKSGKAG